MSVAISIALGLLTAGILIYVRARKRDSLQLRPNCLLTKHPIVILENKSTLPSLFKKDRIHTSEFLCAHGYISCDIQFLNNEMNNLEFTKVFNSAVKDMPAFHLIYPHEFKQQIENEKNKYILSGNNKIITSTELTDFSPDNVLNTAISLAERDFQCSH